MTTQIVGIEWENFKKKINIILSERMKSKMLVSAIHKNMIHVKALDNKELHDQEELIKGINEGNTIKVRKGFNLTAKHITMELNNFQKLFDSIILLDYRIIMHLSKENDRTKDAKFKDFFKSRLKDIRKNTSDWINWEQEEESDTLVTPVRADKTTLENEIIHRTDAMNLRLEISRLFREFKKVERIENNRAFEKGNEKQVKKLESEVKKEDNRLQKVQDQLRLIVKEVLLILEDQRKEDFEKMKKELESLDMNHLKFPKKKWMKLSKRFNKLIAYAKSFDDHLRNRFIGEDKISDTAVAK